MSDNIDIQCEVCVSTLHFTAKETIYQLRIAVKEEVEKLPSVLSLHGFEVRGMNNDPDCSEVAAIGLYPYNDQDDPDAAWMTKAEVLHKALKTQQVQHFVENQRCLCFIPIRPFKSSYSIWVAEFYGAVNDHELASILIMSKIYHNCVSLISLHTTDPLTGLKNRQALSDRLSRILKNKRRSKDSSSVEMPCICMLDIDFFKRINDEFGHLYGDEVLLLFAGLMKKTFREDDFLFRYGGEEFMILLATRTEAESKSALERFRKAVDKYVFPQVGHVTVSIGFVHMTIGDLPSSLIDKADRALYYAKEHGRNQVCSYQMLSEEGLLEDGVANIDVELF